MNQASDEGASGSPGESATSAASLRLPTPRTPVMPTAEQRRFRIGAFAGSIPVFAFGATYAYQMGRAVFFGLPLDLVKVDLSSVIAAMLPIAIAIGLYAVLVFNPIRQFQLLSDDQFETVQGWLFAETLALAVSMIFFRLSAILWVMVVWGALTSVIVAVGLRRKARPRVPPYQDLGLVGLLVSLIGRKWLELLMVILVVFALVYNFGYYLAAAQRTFLVSRDKESAIVLSRYSDQLVASPYKWDDTCGCATLKPIVAIYTIGQPTTPQFLIRRIGLVQRSKVPSGWETFWHGALK